MQPISPQNSICSNHDSLKAIGSHCHLFTVVQFLLTDVGKFHHLISILDGLSWQRSLHCSVVFEVLVRSAESFTSSSAPNTEKNQFLLCILCKNRQICEPSKNVRKLSNQSFLQRQGITKWFLPLFFPFLFILLNTGKRIFNKK